MSTETYSNTTTTKSTCSDIFYQVKKQILDKLDIILQKINLQIIDSKHTDNQDFTFIELAQFENQISMLFHYLDKLYESLNSSISYSSNFSTRQKYKEIDNGYTIEELRLLKEVNENMKQQIKRLQNQKNCMEKEIGYLKKWKTDLKQQKLPKIQQKLNQFHTQMKFLHKNLRSQLKQYKFSLIQNRVQILSKLKQFQAKQIQSQILHPINQNKPLHSNSTLQPLQKKQSSCLSQISSTATICEQCQQIPYDKQIQIMKQLDDLLNLC